MTPLRSYQPVTTFSECSIACVPQTIEGRVRKLDQLSRPETMDTSDSTDFLKALERKYLRSLGTKLGRCAELLLVVALSRVRAIKSSDVQANVSEAPVAKANIELRLFAKAVLVSIEYNAIDDMVRHCRHIFSSNNVDVIEFHSLMLFVFV